MLLTPTQLLFVYTKSSCFVFIVEGLSYYNERQHVSVHYLKIMCSMTFRNLNQAVF